MIEKTVSHLSEFCDVVGTIVGEWSERQGIWATPVFRGQPDARWELVPGLYRFDWADEREMVAQFKRRAAPFLEGSRPAHEWEWYILMQHYGLPTRLLDWSEGAVLGLYFGVRTRLKGQSAAVWMLNTVALNDKAVGREELLEMHDAVLAPYWKDDQQPTVPVAIVPSHLSRRVAAQRSCFTLHGRDRQSLHKGEAAAFVAKIVIPDEAVWSIRAELDLAGIGDTTVFPDLDGLCRELRTVWALPDLTEPP